LRDLIEGTVGRDQAQLVKEACRGNDPAERVAVSPWENGCCESFNSKLRDELLKGEIFYSLAEARIVIEGWRQHYNTLRPHSSPGTKPPAPEVMPWPAPPAQVAPPAAPTVAPKRTMH